VGDNVCSSETAFDVIERVNERAFDLTKKCERLADHLCGPSGSDVENDFGDRAVGVLPAVEQRMRWLSLALSRADRALERIESCVPPMAVCVPKGPHNR
jgi:hypothetical protein